MIPRPSSKKLVPICMLLLALCLMAGCSDDDNPTPAGGGGTGASGAYTGIFTGGSTGAGTGTLGFSIPAGYLAVASSVTTTLGSTGVSITGSVTSPSGTFPMSGTYDPATGSVTLQTTSGPVFQFNGTLQPNGTFQGTCVTPAGNGVFVTLHGDGTAVTVYCGSYERCDTAICDTTTPLGALNVAVSGILALFTISSPDGAVIVAGTVSTSGGHTFVELDFAYGTDSVHAGGEIVGSDIGGDWAVVPAGTGDTGIWSGSTVRCQGTR